MTVEQLAFEVFRIAGGDTDYEPHPTTKDALNMLIDLVCEYEKMRVKLWEYAK